MRISEVVFVNCWTDCEASLQDITLSRARDGRSGPVRARRSRSGPVRSGLPRSMCCGSRPVKMPPAFRDSLDMQMGGVVGQSMRSIRDPRLHYGQRSGQADSICILGDPRNANGVHQLSNLCQKENANSICVSRAALNADECASGRTDLRCILADWKNANRFWHWPAMTPKVAGQISLAFWEIREMQMGFTIGQILSKRKIEFLFAFPARHLMQINVLVA